MCVTHSRHCGGGAAGDRAVAFAGAAVLSVLGMSDWQVSQDVEAAMRSAVEALVGEVGEVGIAVHHDSVDVWATAGEVTTRRVCFPRRPFRTPIVCHVELGSVAT